MWCLKHKIEKKENKEATLVYNGHSLCEECFEEVLTLEEKAREENLALLKKVFSPPPVQPKGDMN